MVRRWWNGNPPAIGVPVFFLTNELIHAKVRYGIRRGVVRPQRCALIYELPPCTGKPQNITYDKLYRFAGDPHELQPLSRRSNRQGIGPNRQEAGRDAQWVDPQGAARMAGQEDAWQSRLAVAD